MTHLIFSWNIDSIKAEKWDKLTQFITENKPSIICLNETKSKVENLSNLFLELEDYDSIINSHYPAHHHGVAILIHKDLEWVKLKIELDCPTRNDNKSEDPCAGRLIAILVKNLGNDLENLVIVSTYSPNSGIDYHNPLKNLTYRTESWDASLFTTLQKLELEFKNVIWIGDINVAPTDLDVSHPKIFERHAGFTLEERESFSNFLQKTGWIDIWRHQHPKDLAYTFKGYRGYRYRLRLDNCIITPSLLTRIKNSTIYPDKDFLESDHNPISITILKTL